jgi:hypothetical protein
MGTVVHPVPFPFQLRASAAVEATVTLPATRAAATTAAIRLCLNIFVSPADLSDLWPPILPSVKCDTKGLVPFFDRLADARQPRPDRSKTNPDRGIVSDRGARAGSVRGAVTA